MFDYGVGIRNPLFFVGVVENNNDLRLEGRCQVRAFGIHGTIKEVPTDMLPWAIVGQGGYDPNVVPKINSWVYGMFLDGRDAQQPLILGMIPTQSIENIDPDFFDPRQFQIFGHGEEQYVFGYECLYLLAFLRFLYLLS